MKTVFVASSRRYYDQVKEIKRQLDDFGVKGFYPYFDVHDDASELDEEKKKQLTLGHFPELDQVDVIYVLAPGGYMGCSVTIEASYAYAKGKEVIVSEPPSELALRAIVSSIMSPEEFISYASKK